MHLSELTKAGHGRDAALETTRRRCRWPAGVDSEMVAAQDGYSNQSNRLWGPDGNLVVLSRQSMMVFG